MSTVLVTGAAGLLGRFVVRELLAHGYDVRGLDRRQGEADITWHVGDVTSPELVQRAMAAQNAGVGIGIDDLQRHRAAVTDPVERRGHLRERHVATTDGIIDSIALVPPDPPAAPEALKAIAAADWVVLGPGSWFTSVIPHLLVPALRQALVSTDARVVVVLNLSDEVGETPGFGPADHLAVLVEHAPDLRVHTVLADSNSTAEELAELEHVVAAYGARLVVADVAESPGSARHDTLKLAAAYSRIISGDA